MNKKTLIIVISSVIGLLLIVLFVFPLFKSKEKKQKEEEKKKLPKEKITEAEPTQSEYDKYFPLKKGDRNEWVRKMQEGILMQGNLLPMYGADGIYGDETEAALIELGLPTVVYVSTLYKLLNIN